MLREHDTRFNLLNVLAPLGKEEPPPPQPKMGFFTDTSVCIGCKACEVACRQWNQLPAPEPVWSGSSYDNTRHLSARTWRHVQFVERIDHGRGKPLPVLPLFEDRVAEARENGTIPETPPGTALPFFNSERWLMHSDVCKHCANAPCHEACPTGAIIRTEYDTVYVQQDICNGCGYCVVACPFGVIARDESGDYTAHKCTLCYDRLKDGLEPACAKACPTDSITFGEVEQLKQKARERLGILHERGVPEARLYGVDDQILDGGLNSFFLLLEEPEVYNLPRNPQRPANNVIPASLWSIIGALLLGVLGALFFREKKGGDD
ncbi:formate dehydrogenase iron-sulfur subunit [Thermosporothrix hazakensis]|jgi:formate dehydrogenase iron-sulfur subunit|uniref:Formate dehydrogenase iron-sulfur subunit n=2 Tax=Thermosporothrix TaxID=768650 RepID=A0A326UE73_THEHA|nr:4Fe-4S dicluster domain-containing protein [Thermosporothrix hazakensis]PZW36225.1 formate dehydrogenase iron-sulfur subunit [Thermosporothrix hazakensis]BBH88688.1 ferredoxin [Thermosporothrix sp. COM3]GCE46874.1 ferredoxin [Thermosporothrix hazakensis]